MALHTISALLLWAVLRKLGLSASASWLGAMLFALHPVNVESVAWITERKNTLPLPLLLGALWCWLHGDANDDGRKGRRWRMVSLLLFVFSLLAKTAGVMLPVVLLVLAWWRRSRIERREILGTAPFFVASAALGAMTAWYQLAYAINAEVVRADGFLSRTAIAGRAVWFYLGKALWPVGLSFAYPRWPAVAAGDWWTAWLPPALLVAAGAGLWRWKHRPWARAVLTALMVYVLMLVPVLGFVNIYFMRYALVADHWQYFAMPALLALVAAGVTGLAERGVAVRRTLAAVVAAALVLCGAMTWRQAATYHDLVTLWRATLKQSPRSWLPHNNLGGYLLLQRRYDESMGYLRTAIDIDPSLTDPYNNMGTAYYGKGDLEAALDWYTRATRVAPMDVESLCNVGTTLAEMGRSAEGLVYLERAVRAAPRSSQAHYKYGATLAGASRFQEAEREYRISLSIQPDNPYAHNNLGGVLVRLGRIEEAINEFREALRINPNHPGAAQNLNNVEIARMKSRVITP
ncbi:MAG: tetratricopeptide repeat protein [Planctomycetes bacterium]|nr:tetratricopeptide repeat protein [Planctomycetota bacterium]